MLPRRHYDYCSLRATPFTAFSLALMPVHNMKPPLRHTRHFVMLQRHTLLRMRAFRR